MCWSVGGPRSRASTRSSQAQPPTAPDWWWAPLASARRPCSTSWPAGRDGAASVSCAYEGRRGLVPLAVRRAGRPAPRPRSPWRPSWPAPVPVPWRSSRCSTRRPKAPVLVVLDDAQNADDGSLASRARPGARRVGRDTRVGRRRVPTRRPHRPSPGHLAAAGPGAPVGGVGDRRAAVGARRGHRPRRGAEPRGRAAGRAAGTARGRPAPDPCPARRT